MIAPRSFGRLAATSRRSLGALRSFSNTTPDSKAVLIRGGTIVNADREFKGDVLSIGEKIVSVSEGEAIAPPAGLEVETIDAGGCYVMPGGIDPQTHMEIPFMGTRAIDDFYTGLAAAQTGGTTMLMDFVIPGKGQRVMEAWENWREWASKAAGDYSFHVAITWWDDTVKDDMAALSKLGVNSFKHFLAYKGAIMADDEILVKSFQNCADLGCMATIHAENGELISHLQQQVFDSGVTGPEGHPASRPPECEGEAANRAIRIAEMIGIPVYIVHTSSRDAMEAVAAARARGQVAFSEVLSQHLVIDDSIYHHPDWRTAAHHVMSPPFRNKKHQESLWNALTSGIAQTTATDHCAFNTEQKAAGKDDFRVIPNGTGGLEDRMNILWHHGVNAGKLTRNQFVEVTSANAAKIFNIYVETIEVPCHSPIELLRSERTGWTPAELGALVVDVEGLDAAIVEGFMNTTGARPGLVFFELHNALWDPTKRRQLRRLVRSLLRRQYRLFCCPQLCGPLIPGSLRGRPAPQHKGKAAAAAARASCDAGVNALAWDPAQLAGSTLAASAPREDFVYRAAPCSEGSGRGWACRVGK